jgi:hypothetical protein
MTRSKFYFLIIIKLSLLIFSSSQEINFKFTLNRLEEYCLSESFQEKTFVIYNISSTSIETKYIYKFYNEVLINNIMQKFNFPFTTKKSGDYELCIMNYDHHLIEVNFSLKYGLAAKDYSSIAKKKDLKPTELIVEKMEDRARDIAKIISFEKNKSIGIEGILDELLNKIIIYSTSIVICMIFVGIMEIVYLKKFMKNRKII